MNKKILFAALAFVALTFGFVACDVFDPDLGKENEDENDNIENVVDDDSTEDNIEGEEDYYSCDSTEIVCTGKAYETTSTFTKIAATVHVPTTLLGQCTLGIQFSENLNDLEEHENVKSFTTSNLTGNDYTVKLSYLLGNTTYYYCAYVYLNGVYHYGLIRSFKTLEANINGHTYVDLGLPSGLKWATCNVGASSPEEYGSYFAWGETTPKTTYDWSTYKWCKGSRITMTKYCNNSNYGTVDNKTVLDKEDDAASVNMGGSWRMPTKAEQDELLTECTWTWSNLHGVKGYEVKSKKNNNSIFLPAAGYSGSSDLYSAGSRGYYWSSSLDSGNSNDAYYLYFDSGDVHWDYDDNHYYGKSVRGVCE